MKISLFSGETNLSKLCLIVLSCLFRFLNKPRVNLVFFAPQLTIAEYLLPLASNGLFTTYDLCWFFCLMQLLPFFCYIIICYTYYQTSLTCLQGARAGWVRYKMYKPQCAQHTRIYCCDAFFMFFCTVIS